MRLLIVEDNDAQIKSYEDAIDEHNQEVADSIIHTFVKTLPEAEQKLESQDFDAAIVDLNLSGSTDSDYEGNEILKKIVNIRRFPVFVHSSFTGGVDPSLQDSIFFKKIERTSSNRIADILNELKKIHDTGITKILGRDGKIENRLTEIFWQHIASSFQGVMDRNMTENQLLRYIAGHLYEHLEFDVAGEFDKFFPEEVYIYPSIKKSFFTGSIIKNKSDNKYCIILTPQCDMAHAGKAEQILVAAIDEKTLPRLKTELDELQGRSTSAVEEDLKKSLEEELDRKKRYLNGLLKNNGSPKNYFLPKSHWFKGGLIDFKRLSLIVPSRIEQDYELVATTNNHFLRDIISRFAHYYSRQGSPDLRFSVDDYLS